jgi:frataxin-like iron-binding protein CyaY
MSRICGRPFSNRSSSQYPIVPLNFSDGFFCRLRSPMLTSIVRSFAIGFNAFKTDGEFKAKAAEVFYAIGDLLTAKYESVISDFAVDAQDDSLTINAAGKQFLLSRQGPARQIWVASPRQGSVKFDFDTDEEKWIDQKRPTVELSEFVQADVEGVIGSKRALGYR